MRHTSQFAPMMQTSVGFDRLFDALEHVDRMPSIGSPAYNVLRKGDDGYRIEVAAPGLSKADVHISYEPNLLRIAADAASPGEGTFLYRGIPDRNFDFQFELADHVEVTEASLADGMLTIDLRREVPEAMKPRKIAISHAKALNDNGHSKAA